MTAEQTKAIEKVRKLFALSKGTTSEEEAESAVQMAKDILSKYNLSIKDLDDYKEKTSCDENDIILDTSKIAGWTYTLGSLMKCIYDVEVLFAPKKKENSKVVIVGVEPNLTMATNTFTWLYTGLKVLRFCNNRREYTSISDKNSWRVGFIHGLFMKVQEQKAQQVQERGLVLVQKGLITDYISKYHMTQEVNKVPRIHNQSAYVYGMITGKDFSLNEQIEG